MRGLFTPWQSLASLTLTRLYSKSACAWINFTHQLNRIESLHLDRIYSSFQVKDRHALAIVTRTGRVSCVASAKVLQDGGVVYLTHPHQESIVYCQQSKINLILDRADW